MKRLIKASSTVTGVNLNKIADSLFEYFREYGAVSVSRYIDEKAINFNLTADYDLLHYGIISQGYKEVTQYGTDPVVTEYINEAGNVCVKLEQWSSGILRIHVSEEAQEDVYSSSIVPFLNIDEDKAEKAAESIFNRRNELKGDYPEVDWMFIESPEEVTFDIVLLVDYDLMDGEDYQVGNGDFDIMPVDKSDERWSKVREELGGTD